MPCSMELVTIVISMSSTFWSNTFNRSSTSLVSWCCGSLKIMPLVRFEFWSDLMRSLMRID